MKLPFPTRNDARGLLSSLEYKNQLRSTSIKELCSYCILCYKKKHGHSDSVTFVFTNALVDMFKDMNVNDENAADEYAIWLNGKSNDHIDDYFINFMGEKLETFIEKLNEHELIQILNSGSTTFDSKLFNNPENNMRELLHLYQKFKIQKGMMFSIDDIKQITIDYSVVLCYQHFIQNGFLNKGLISNIVIALTAATNTCLTVKKINYVDIEQIVLKDISTQKSIKAAVDLIKQI
jgi:hypothetical protein